MSINKNAIPMIVGTAAFLSLQSCMKDRCYSCITTHPLVGTDTFHMQDSIHSYCGISSEKIKIIEASGTFSKTYTIKDSSIRIQTRTSCK